MIHPQQFSIVSEGDLSLPPVPSERLRAAHLRDHFRNPPAWQPEVHGDRFRTPEARLTPAAVLVPLIQHAGGDVSMLLTRRTAKMKKHSGQIAFPGGKVDPEDRDAIDAALREAHEEVGLQRERIEILGTMPHYETGTGYLITPVVGLMSEGFEMRLNGDEVDEAFTVPMQFLMNPRHHQRHCYDLDKVRREFYAMPYRVAPAEGETVEYYIWGATAAMIRNLYRMLAA